MNIFCLQLISWDKRHHLFPLLDQHPVLVEEYDISKYARKHVNTIMPENVGTGVHIGSFFQNRITELNCRHVGSQFRKLDLCFVFLD